jgi:membrane protein implicated in regulation of membrane protease activity
MAEFFAAADPCILLWLLLFIVFVAAELVTVGLTSIWFAAGALIALLVAICGGPLWLQGSLFVIVSLALLAATRPLAKRFINNHTQKTNADSIIGSTIRIAEAVNNREETGTAVVRGQEWTVRSADDLTVIASGETARVTGISGVKLIVEKIKED